MTPNSRWIQTIVLVAVAAALLACDGGSGTDPASLRYGQVGQIRVTLLVPLSVDQGELQQSLIGESSGAWELTERISYLGVLGDENVMPNPGDPAGYASAYAGMIIQINETEGLTLFTDELDPELIPTCGITRTTVVLTVQDDSRGEAETWVRCSSGDFSNLTPAGSGPDAAASRVTQVASLAGQFTLGDRFASVYSGSVPFATLDRGEDSFAQLGGSFTFTSPLGWTDFWKSHVGRDEIPPHVDFGRDMVVIGAVGLRAEAGDSVEVRRILQIDGGTLVEVVERVPGDFCSPADRPHVPFHIALSPKTDPPVLFPKARVERVPCG